MKRFAGVGVPLEGTAIGVVDEAGGIVREARVPGEPEATIASFRGLGLAMERIGPEACSPAARLHAGLTAAGRPAVRVGTRRAEAAVGAMPDKAGRAAARGPARIIRAGRSRAVHAKGPACRALPAARRLALDERRDLEDGPRASPRAAGPELGTPAREASAGRVRELVDAVLSASAEPPLATVAATTRGPARLAGRIPDIVREEPVRRRPTGVPGVGPPAAPAFRATIDRPDRFRRPREVGARLGPAPKRRRGGETDVQGGIGRRGDEPARTAPRAAARSLLTRGRTWPTLRAWGMRVAERRGMARARVAVARELAVIVRRMGADDSASRRGEGRAAPAAA